MKKLIILIGYLLIFQSIYAYDFSSICSTGQTLYYNITGSNTVTITCPGNMSGPIWVYNPLTMRYSQQLADSYTQYVHNSNDSPGYYRISQVFERPSGAVIIPTKVTYNDITYDVINLGANAFSGCTDAVLFIPNTITYTESAVFGISTYNMDGDLLYYDNGLYFVDSLREKIVSCDDTIAVLSIPNTVKIITEYAFVGQLNIQQVFIPNSVIYIGNNAFMGCDSIQYLNYNANVNTSIFNEKHIKTLVIGDSIQNLVSTFSNCSQLSSVYLPTTLRSIGNNVFSGCPLLNSIIIPDSVMSIGDYAFEECTGLLSITIPNRIKVLSEGVFRGCTSLTSVIIHDEIDTIGSYAFSGCTQLNGKFVIPENTTTIGTGSFAGCSNLDSLIIGHNVTNIELGAFYCKHPLFRTVLYWTCKGT